MNAREKFHATMNLEAGAPISKTEYGYVPHIEYFVSPDACWDNFKYYRTKLNDIIDSLSG